MTFLREACPFKKGQASLSWSIGVKAKMDTFIFPAGSVLEETKAWGFFWRGALAILCHHHEPYWEIYQLQTKADLKPRRTAICKVSLQICTLVCIDMEYMCKQCLADQAVSGLRSVPGGGHYTPPSTLCYPPTATPILPSSTSFHSPLPTRYTKSLWKCFVIK